MNDIVTAQGSADEPGVRTYVSQSDVHTTSGLSLNTVAHGEITGITAGISGSVNIQGQLTFALATVMVVINTIDVSTAAFIEGVSRPASPRAAVCG